MTPVVARTNAQPLDYRVGVLQGGQLVYDEGRRRGWWEGVDHGVRQSRIR